MEHAENNELDTKLETVHNDPIFSDPDYQAKEKKMVRTLDLTLLPMLWILYLFNYLDRTNVAQARLNTFEADLGINGSHYSTAVAVLTAGFILGIVEAPLFPGAVSGLIAAGVFSGLHGAQGLAGWQWLFIIEGAIGGALALLAFFMLPDYPHSKTGSAAKWSMSEELRHLAAVRMAADRVSTAEEEQTVWNGLKLAVTDYKTWVFVVTNICMTSSYGFNNFFPTIVSGFGIGSRTVSLLMTAPPYIVGAIMSFVVAFSSDRRKERGYHISANVAMAIVGFIISVSTINAPARYVASFLYTTGSFSANALVYTWAVSTLSQTPEKRAAAGAIVNIMGHIGNIISPYFFIDSHAPRYTMAMILMMSFGACTIVLANVLKWLLRKENRKLLVESEAAGRVYNPYTT
ncbi:hypothetical protein BN1708_010060 [Verticillium longisporum]|uniref:Major facilitator superfamily (MFS) profile domain-containing protein n=1 Tax=Verticillium longisporum TaxID=100787 RepID=A0A0G4KN31_VERLO|nr:hypothetical protein BN1708_010060 [Verticillium longisporum]